MMPREEELRVLDSHISNPNLKKHMIAVSAIMRKLAQNLGEDEELWEAVGLLHDVDYEKVGDMSRHGLLSAEMLKDSLPEEGLHAVKAHNEITGFKAEKPIDLALIASDSASGLAIATALMMPHKTLMEVKVSSIKSKFNDRSFARNVDRNRIMYCTKLNITLEDFLTISLNALLSVREELGL